MDRGGDLVIVNFVDPGRGILQAPGRGHTMNPWIAFGIGLFVGTWIGVWLAALFLSGGRDDKARGAR